MAKSPRIIIERSERCVCRMCGGPLEPKIVIYNKYGGSGVELYCSNCRKIEFGTEPEIYRLAKNYVEQVEYDYFTDMEADKRHFQLNVSKVCEVLSWAFRQLEILDSKGIHKDCLCNFALDDLSS
ncbi:MAG: hypothetical protein UDB11_09970 [Peptococcaceae bacterium]|nr:hypothetical protein [Peptococcaceae bacterium]